MMPDTPKPGLRETLELIWLADDGLCQHVDLSALICDLVQAVLQDHGTHSPDWPCDCDMHRATNALAAKYDLEK